MLRRVFPLAISVIALMTASIGCGALEAMGERSLGYPPTPTRLRLAVGNQRTGHEDSGGYCHCRDAHSCATPYSYAGSDSDAYPAADLNANSDSDAYAYTQPYLNMAGSCHYLHKPI